MIEVHLTEDKNRAYSRFRMVLPDYSVLGKAGNHLHVVFVGWGVSVRHSEPIEF